MSDEQYLAPKRQQKRYEQRFRDAWLQNPLLKDWLRDCYSPEGVREARCLYCNIRLCPRFIDLSKHAMTRKHLRNTPHEGSIIDQSSDIEEAEEEQEHGEVEEYEEADDHKGENVVYEVILDHHSNKEVVLEQHGQEETSMEQLQSQMDVSGNSSTNAEPPLKILKMGFKNKEPSQEHKEISPPTTLSRKVKLASMEPNILLERKKLVLQIKNEELRAYKLQLEAFKIERELGFGRSIFTKNLPTKTNL